MKVLKQVMAAASETGIVGFDKLCEISEANGLKVSESGMPGDLMVMLTKYGLVVESIDREDMCLVDLEPDANLVATDRLHLDDCDHLDVWYKGKKCCPKFSVVWESDDHTKAILDVGGILFVCYTDHVDGSQIRLVDPNDAKTVLDHESWSWEDARVKTEQD
jgi:hypothetical protein